MNWLELRRAKEAELKEIEDQLREKHHEISKLDDQLEALYKEVGELEERAARVQRILAPGNPFVAPPPGEEVVSR